jgi:hypothetical protein
MKKLVFILTAVLLTAMSVNVFAQNNGVTPTPGSTFTYNVTDNGNTYLWSVTKGDLTTVTTDATIGTAGAATTTIAWAPTATIGSIYYVHLLETDANSCSNQKVLKVTISASQFYLAIAADQTSPACYDGAVVVTLNAGDPRYNHGKATISYTITPTGLGSATGYSFDLADVLSQTTNFASVPTVTSGNASITTGVVTVTDTNPVTIEYVVTNSNLYDNTTDAAGTSANFKQTVNITNGVTSLGVRANTSTPANYTDETDVARPATTSIGFN